MVFGVQEEDSPKRCMRFGVNFDVLGAIGTNDCLDLEVGNGDFWSSRRGLAQAVYAI